MSEFIFLKLGGSLITDKSKANKHKPGIIDRIANEIAEFHDSNPNVQLLIGHGSGSFGHQAAKKYDTYNGVSSREEWRGFFNVWYKARSLNNIVTDALQKAGLPVISFPVSASAEVANHQIHKISLEPIKSAIRNGGIPLVFGDVAFDQVLGGTILSTEDIFAYLATHFSPTRILLAGVEEGVFEDYPNNEKLISEINSQNYPDMKKEITGSVDPDVTGGMAGKVEKMFSLLSELHSTNVQIFSGILPGSTKFALEGHASGTKISNI
jgi:isopentenyl phosphate kinase